jgi:hypothetical protein
MTATKTLSPQAGKKAGLRSKEPASARAALDLLANQLSTSAGTAFKNADLKSIDGYEFNIPGNPRKVLVWCHRHDSDDALHFCTNGCRVLGRADQVAEVAGIVLRMLRAPAAA